jgi:hypothetical protein
VPAPASGFDDPDPIVQTWTGPKVRELIQSPRLRQVYERWMTLIENRLPRLNEMFLSDRETELNDAMLLLRLPNDIAIIHQGAAAIEMIGRDINGTLLSEGSARSPRPS